MAEGDTIHRLAGRLDEALGGVPLTAATAPAPQSPLRRQAERLASLRGAALERAEARGKHLLLHFGDLVLHSHMAMSGSWRLHRAGERWERPPGRAWALLETPVTVAAQFGGPTLVLRTQAELRADPRLRALGPDPLADGFEAERAVAALKRAGTGRELGEVLLDQRVLAGVGNVLKSEACFAARLSPWRRIGELADADLGRVVAETVVLMRESLATGRRRRTIYRRAGGPCPRCGSRIRSRGQGDSNRTTYWCPRCQV